MLKAEFPPGSGRFEDSEAGLNLSYQDFYKKYSKNLALAPKPYRSCLTPFAHTLLFGTHVYETLEVS